MRELFLLDPNVVFLNHGSFGACPRPVFAEYQRLQLELEREPVEFLGLGRRFPSLIAQARERLASYVGAPAGDLVFVPNATTGANLVARSLDFAPGDEVIATTHEYGGNEFLWRYLEQRTGLRYVEVDTLPATAADDLLAAVTPRTRALFVSHITSPTALLFPVEEICARARDAGIVTIVDGAHAPGHVTLDLESVGADFYTGNCHKWLCSPKGAGFLHARPEVQPLLEPVAVSWDWEHDTFAERHRWAGTRDPSPWLAVPAAIDFQVEHDWDAVRARCHALAVRAKEELTTLLGTTAYAASDDEFVQMVTVRLPPCDAEAVQRRLFDEHRIEVVAQHWRGEPTLRASFQGYNDDSDLDALLEALPRALS
ncbi:MAG: aminotransferase class V-fold PLP-dependent enzyme [Gaiellaceae bacterium]